MLIAPYIIYNKEKFCQEGEKNCILLTTCALYYPFLLSKIPLVFLPRFLYIRREKKYVK